MTMSDKTINLKRFFSSSSLVTRQAARTLFEYIDKNELESIKLNFKGIESASRSFFDELLDLENKFRMQDKKIDHKNVPPFLYELQAKVKRGQNAPYENSKNASSFRHLAI